jgi:hypothetical protein
MLNPDDEYINTKEIVKDSFRRTVNDGFTELLFVKTYMGNYQLTNPFEWFIVSVGEIFNTDTLRRIGINWETVSDSEYNDAKNADDIKISGNGSIFSSGEFNHPSGEKNATNFKYKLLIVDSKSGVHVGVHAIRNIINATNLDEEKFFEVTGYTLIDGMFKSDKQFKQAVKLLADSNEYVALAVMKGNLTKEQRAQSAKLPAVLIVKNE